MLSSVLQAPAPRSASARSRLAGLKPRVGAIAQASGDADEIIAGFDSLVRQVSVGAHLFASLNADPSALDVLLQLVTRAPRLAPTIASRPDAFDALIAGRPSADAMCFAEIARALCELKAGCGSDTELLRRIQRFTRQHQFLIGARAVLGLMPIGKAEEAFSKLTLAVVQSLAGLAERKFQRRHGRAPGCEWALVALGKFGGGELSATSDLDLMLVYDAPGDAQCSGAAPSLPMTQYFNVLAQSVIAVLGASDPDGPLFDVDFRLRPWGNKGPIATRLPTLGDYLEQESWTYERMAMTRARVVTGSPRFAAAIDSVIRAALQRCAGRRELRTDVLEMRALIHTAKATSNPWDIKHVRGGLIDIEFIAQYLMLRHADEQPALLHAATAEALRRLCSGGILGLRDFELLSGALSSFKHVMQATRIACVGGPLPEGMSNAFAAYLPATMGESSLAAVEAKLSRLQACVHDAFDRLTGA